MNIKVTIVVFLSFFVFASESFASCSKPSRPSCASDEGIYNKKASYEACQSEIESFHGSSMKYIECLKAELEVTVQEVQGKIDMVSDEANSVIKEFNCKSGMQEDC